MNSKETLEVVVTEEEVKVETAPIELSVADLDGVGGGFIGAFPTKFIKHSVALRTAAAGAYRIPASVAL